MSLYSFSRPPANGKDFSVYLLQTYDQMQRKNEVAKFREKLKKVKKYEKVEFKA
jgi:hypothetical protein